MVQVHSLDVGMQVFCGGDLRPGLVKMADGDSCIVQYDIGDVQRLVSLNFSYLKSKSHVLC